MALIFTTDKKNIVEKLTGQKVEMLDMGVAVDKKQQSGELLKKRI